MEVGDDQLEFFLDDGWSVIGRFHRWLTSHPTGIDEPVKLAEQIRELQSLWASAEDLGLKRIGHVSLLLEQLLERFCAGTLEFTPDRLNDITAGVEVLQDLILGLEATRQEPPLITNEVVLRLERHSAEPVEILSKQKPLTAETPEELPQFERPTIQPDVEILVAPTHAEEPVVEQIADSKTPDSRDVTPVAATAEDSVEPTVLAMLQEFVIKLDEACHRLHADVVADEAPYVSTTTRLQHLIQVTRALVDQLVSRKRSVAQIALAKISAESVSSIEGSAFPALSREIVSGSLLSNEKIAMPQIASPAASRVEHPAKQRCILIVEESLFYRQMINLAVQSVGFETVVIESVDSGIERLKQSQDYCAVLIGTLVSPDDTDVLEMARHEHGVKVIGLTSGPYQTDSMTCFDDLVARSNPRQLRVILNRLTAPYGAKHATSQQLSTFCTKRSNNSDPRQSA